MTGPAVCRCLRLSVSRENDALNPDCSTENRQQGDDQPGRPTQDNNLASRITVAL